MEEEITQSSLQTARATIVLPARPNETWFFDGTQCCAVDLVDDCLVNNEVLSIHDRWPGLKPFTKRVTAILPNDPHQEKAYFFSGNQCIFLDLNTGKPAEIDGERDSEPFNWHEMFQALAEVMPTFDCVVPWFWEGPQVYKASYYFGDKVVHYDMCADQILGGPGELPEALRKAGFSKVDAFAFVPGTNHEEGYFFSGDEITRVTLRTMEESSDVMTVAEKWKSLGAVAMFGVVKI